MMDIKSSFHQQSQEAEKQQTESDLESCDLHPIEPVKLRLPNYIRHSSPSPLRFAADGASPSTSDPPPADEPLLPRPAISPRWPRYRVSRSRRLSRCEILESSPTPLRLQDKMQHVQYLTRSRTRSPSPSLYMLTNRHLESGYLTRSRVKLWKQLAKQPCPVHGKIICRQLPRHQSTPKLQSGHIANHQQSQHSPIYTGVRRDLGKFFSGGVQHKNGPAAKYIPTPQRLKTNSKKIETKSRRKSFLTNIRKLATRFQKSVSKAIHGRQTVDVCNSSNVEHASDVQWVELNSKQKQNYFKGSTEDLDSSRHIIRCFKVKKVKFNKLNPAKAHIRRLMKEKQKRALSTPARAKRLSMLQSPSKMPLDEMHNASIETSSTLQQEGNGLDLKKYGIVADHVQGCPVSPLHQTVRVNPLPKPVSPKRHSPRSENQLPKIPPIIIKETAVVTSKASTESQKVSPLVISKIRTVINPLPPQHVDTSSLESSCNTSRQTETSITSSQYSQEQSICSSPSLFINNIVTQPNTFASTTPRRRDYTWISPMIQSKVDKILQEPTFELLSASRQTLSSSTTLPPLQLSPISPGNSQRQPVLQPIQSPTTRQLHMKEELAAVVAHMPQAAQKSYMPTLSVFPTSSQHQFMASPTHPSSRANSASQSNTPSVKTGHQKVSTASPMIKHQQVPNVSADTTKFQQVPTATTMGKHPQVSSDSASSLSKTVSSTAMTGPQQMPPNPHPSCDTHQSVLVTSTNTSVQEEASNFLRYFYKYGKTRKQMKALVAKTLSHHALRRETSTIILNHLINDSPLTQYDILTIQLFLYQQRKKQEDNSNQQSINPVSSDRTSAEKTKFNHSFFQPLTSKKSDVAMKTSRGSFSLYTPSMSPLEAMSSELTTQTLSQRVSQSSSQMSDPNQQPSKVLPSLEIRPHLSTKQQLQLPVLQCLPTQQMTSRTSQPQQVSTTVHQPQQIPVQVSYFQKTSQNMSSQSQQMSTHTVLSQVSPPQQIIPSTPNLAAFTMMTPSNSASAVPVMEISASYSMPKSPIAPDTHVVLHDASFAAKPHHQNPHSTDTSDVLQEAYSNLEGANPHSINTSDVLQGASFAAKPHHQNPHSTDTSDVLQDAYSNLEGANPHSTNTSDVLQDVYSNTEGADPHCTDTSDVPQDASSNLGGSPHSTTTSDVPQDASSNLEGASPHSTTTSDVPQDASSNLEGASPHSTTTSDVPQDASSNLGARPHFTTTSDVPQDASSNLEGASPHSTTTSDVPQDASSNLEGADPLSTNTSDVPQDASSNLGGSPHSTTTSDVPQDASSNLEGAIPHSTTTSDVPQDASSNLEEAIPHSTTTSDVLQDASSNLEGAIPHSTTTSDVPQDASSNLEGASPHSTNTSDVPQDASSNLEGAIPHSTTTSDVPQDASSNLEGAIPHSTNTSDVPQDASSNLEEAIPHSTTTSDVLQDASSNLEGAIPHSTTTSDVPQDASSNLEGASPHSTNTSDVPQDGSSNLEGASPHSTTTSDVPQDASSNLEEAIPHSTNTSDVPQDASSNLEGAIPHSTSTSDVPQDASSNLGARPHSTTTSDVPQDASSYLEGASPHSTNTSDVPQDASSNLEGAIPHSTNTSDVPQDASSNLEGAIPHSTTTSDVPQDASSNLEGAIPHSTTTSDVPQDASSNLEGAIPHSTTTSDVLQDASSNLEGASPHSTNTSDVPQDASSNLEGAIPHSTSTSDVPQDASSNLGARPHSTTTSDVPQDASSYLEGASPHSTNTSDVPQDASSNLEGAIPHSTNTSDVPQDASSNLEGAIPHSTTTSDVPQDASSNLEGAIPHSTTTSDVPQDASSNLEGAIPHSTTTSDVLQDASSNLEGASPHSTNTSDVLQGAYSSTEANPHSTSKVQHNSSSNTEAATLQHQDSHPMTTIGSMVSRNRDINTTTSPAMIIPSLHVHQTEQTLHDDIFDTQFTSAPKSRKRLFTEGPVAEDTYSLPIKKRRFSYSDYLAQNRAWTISSIKSNPDVCTQCDGINEILQDTPENLGRNNNPRPSERSPETQLFSLMCTVNFRTGGKPHLMAKDLVWKLFTIKQLYGNRFYSLDTEVTSRIQSIVMDWTDCDQDHWNKKCVPFINQAIRRLFNEKLRKYEHLLNHRCEDHVTSPSKGSALEPM
ncbi:mucin-2-like [Ostrea edulis]|uniref:mucin-2-like n=1 Tax=Ostrea edulis TaxID=37623 RepID=UPI0024AFCF7B|nr:mucin-2-like [Ostrea edulis]